MEVRLNHYPVYRKNSTYTISAPSRDFSEHKAKEVRLKPPIETRNRVNTSAQIIKIKPVTNENVTGFSVYKKAFSIISKPFSKIFQEYKKNIKHTYEHKIIFSIIEKQLTGKNSTNCITHDIDKMILYLFGFSHNFVSKFHRKHSTHHVESGKKLNLITMMCDNIASSPEFKPEKKSSLREFYNSSSELQNINGFGELLEKYNYGENLNFDQIKRLRTVKYRGSKGLKRAIAKSLRILFH